MFRKNIRKAILAMLVVSSFSFLVIGCASKKYVKQQIDPLTGKVTEVESITKKNTEEIRAVDSRSQQGIQAASQRADAADTHAATAEQKANAAQASADQVATSVKAVDSRFANIDSYKLADSIAVTFKSGRHNLDDEAKAKLDALAAKTKDQKGYVIEIQGFTDSRGAEAFNLDLSQKRAEEVKRYLATSQNIPLFRMSIIGVGKAQPVDDNKTKQGRANNRRVEVRLLRTSV
ncbi:MAG: OmpA family protein [Acidobacteriia bacterium]|nr:OmpA family protein [Terriglobia bacterium]